MSKVYVEASVTYTVRFGAENLHFVCWIVRDEGFVLRILRVSVEYDSSNPALDICG
jgi:hypothetical protein